jgi:hypothetical protein
MSSQKMSTLSMTEKQNFQDLKRKTSLYLYWLRLNNIITFESRPWRIILCVVALLDCFATIWHQYFQFLFHDALSDKNKNHRIFNKKGDVNPGSKVNKLAALGVEITQVIDSWALHIGVLFALLWLIDAFLKAKGKRDEKLTEIDRRRVLGGDDESKSHAGEAWFAYYKTVILQLLLLPVGFYVIVGYLLTGNEKYVTSVLRRREHDLEKDFTSIYSTHSLLYASIHFQMVALNRFLGEEVEAQRKSLWRRILKFAVRRPILFTKRLRLFFTTLRLTKYIGPIMGETAKFLENTSDLMKSLRQHWEVMKAIRLRKKRWDSMNLIDKMHVAATRIQSTVRGTICRKTVKSFMVVLKARKDRIARRLQRVARNGIVASRTQQDLMKLELEKLEEEAKQAKLVGDNIPVARRRRMYQLQDELEKRAKDMVNKHLLLQPNARFAILWKMIFVFCVLLDIAQQIIEPKIKDFQVSGKKVHMSVEQFLVYHLIPKPIKEWKVCEKWFAKGRKLKRLSLLFHSAIPFFRRFHRSSDQNQRPWYCSDFCAISHQSAIAFLRFLLMQAAVIIGIVRYLDVAVTFFLGEIHPKTGILMPKSFVKRWIFPGLLLELVANPQMETTSKLLYQILDCFIKIGPIRIGRWTLVGFYPVASIIKRLTFHMWKPVIQQQNQDCAEKSKRAGQKLLSGSRNCLSIMAPLTTTMTTTTITSYQSSQLIPQGLRESHDALRIVASRSSFALYSPAQDMLGN